ncbi:Norsolorinic acid ketoreductase [Lachnellula subtilissima]|uniref:Norsolorinic acid ketoreductase n=1 Tax=Lachnellula subtilissima TaxID=602034 RepID=A0A8H8U884_9HELO|nr:Norsolorinic acid ketoreductase [Lachnellula subtilissima]
MSPTPPQTIILITGANRGLGAGLLTLYLSLPYHTVIAAVRSPLSPSSLALSSLPTGVGSRLITVKIDACNETDHGEAVETLRSTHGISHLDVVIANAGVSYVFPKVSELKIEDLQGHLTPNVFGVVWLYQATLPLLLKGKRPRWVTMGTIAGSIEVESRRKKKEDFLAFLLLSFSSLSCPISHNHLSKTQNNLPPLTSPPRSQPAMTNAAYGPSKATVHWLTKRMNAEESALAAFVISPGWCQTDMGNSGAKYSGWKKHLGMVELIEGATRERRGGRFWGYEGDLIAW